MQGQALTSSTSEDSSAWVRRESYRRRDGHDWLGMACNKIPWGKGADQRKTSNYNPDNVGNYSHVQSGTVDRWSHCCISCLMWLANTLMLSILNTIIGPHLSSLAMNKYPWIICWNIYTRKLAFKKILLVVSWCAWCSWSFGFSADVFFSLFSGQTIFFSPQLIHT